MTINEFSRAKVTVEFENGYRIEIEGVLDVIEIGNEHETIIDGAGYSQIRRLLSRTVKLTVTSDETVASVAEN